MKIFNNSKFYTISIRILKILLLFYTMQNKFEKKYSCYDNAYVYLTVKVEVKSVM